MQDFILIAATRLMNLKHMEKAEAARILLVDDDVKLSRLTTQFLESQNYVVGVAFDGETALRHVENQKWDLIILDVMMPGLDGFQVLSRIRNISSTPVLMLTGRGSEDDRVLGLDSGADDYVPKITSPRELLARVRALLRRYSVRDPITVSRRSAVEIRGLYIGFDAHEIHLHGNKLVLTPVEFSLLKALVEHKGRVRSRDQLLDEVRNRDYDITDRSIDVQVASLRKKLGDDPKEPRFIKTVRAVGYMFLTKDEALQA